MGTDAEDSEKKITEARKLAGNKPEKPVLSPYGGSRLIVDDDGRHRLGLDRRRRRASN